jgi:hypothetical protein
MIPISNNTDAEILLYFMILISVSYFHDPSRYREVMVMSDLNRGIMKFEGADKPVVVAASAVLVLGAITTLILWAMKAAYAMP